ncbi:MAG: hypothetical protein AB1512_13200 [Thermodesulfobacteriota bacterium]
MTEIELKPTLSHCIETVAKREYERVLSLLLSGKQEDSLLDELELLRLFLESADFRSLRSRCEEALLAGKQTEMVLRSTDGIPPYEIEIRET